MRSQPRTQLYLWALTFVLVVFVLCVAQQQRPSPSPQKPATEDDVIRVTTNLVQVDAVVTDKDGRVVTDLTSADFEVFEEGKLVNHQYFSFVPLVTRQPVQTSEKTKAGTFEQISRSNLKRTFVFLVDNPLIDFGFSSSSATGVSSGSVSLRPRAVRSAEEAEKLLRWFVDSQMSEDDLVAISDTEVNIGVLRSFTNDREVLYAAIRRIRESAMTDEKQIIRLMSVNGDIGFKSLIQQNLAVIDTVSKVIDQVSTLPGRKIVSLISRGMMYDQRLPGSDVVRARIQELIEKANRARVSIYTMSPTGIGNLGGVSMAGSRNTGPGKLSNFGSLQGTQDLDSLIHIAKETGGRAIYSTNDFRVGFAEVLEENRGYYLLGYNPGSETIERPHRIRVVLRRPGLKVQARTTAYANAPASVISNPVVALNTPLAIRDIKVDVTPLFISADGKSSRLVSLAHVDTKGIASKSTLDMIVRITGPDGRTVKEEVDRFSVAADNESLTSVVAVDGAVPGFYRVSVAVSEPQSGLSGSATKFVEVFNPMAGDLVASSLIVSKPMSNGETLDAASLAERYFSPKSRIDYQCLVYNAKSRGAMGALVQVQLTIKRGSETVINGPSRSVSGTEGTPISIGGQLSLPDLPVGTYQLQLAITDSNRKNSEVTRSASFEVRR